MVEIEADVSLSMLEGKRSAIFEYLQYVYDSAKIIGVDIKNKDRDINTFLDASSNIESLRTEFLTVLDSYNKRLLTVKPKAGPDYKPLVAFEQLYSRVKRLITEYSSTQTHKDDLPQKSRPSLPPIELLSFDGDFRSWPLFYASFKSTIHDNPSLTDADKLYYLLGKISGNAQSACAGITPCSENYELIFKTLIDRYEDKRMYASTYMNQMLEFKPISNASASNFDLFVDQYVNAVQALKNLKLNDLCDLFVLHIALKKLDTDTVRHFEMSNSDPSKIPTFDSLVQLIKSRSKMLQRTTSIANPAPSVSSKRATERTRTINKYPSPPKYQTYLNTREDNSYKCLCTNITHFHLFKCPDFNRMQPRDRFKTVKEFGACVNCTSIKHTVSSCRSNASCRRCKLNHHSMLCFNQNLHNRESNHSPATIETAGISNKPSAPGASHDSRASKPAVLHANVPPADVALCSTSIAASRATLQHSSRYPTAQCTTNSTVLLATAQVFVYDNYNNKRVLRVLLDTASQSNFISKECCEWLGIFCHEVRPVVIKGFAGSENIINHTANVKLFSRYNSNVNYEVNCLIVNTITDRLPTALVDKDSLQYLNNLPLADDMFATPNKIDVLLGASLFPHLLLPRVIRGDPSLPLAVETVLGYVIMGTVPTPYAQPSRLTSCCTTVVEPIEALMKKFWELEEVPGPPIQCPEDIECEEFYRKTTERDSISGRYIVALPFHGDIYSLGDSYELARKRFMCLERKLEASPSLRMAYDDAIKNFLNKGYLSPAPTDDSVLPCYTIPHHGVLRQDKPLRPVLDGSCKTTTKVSLNDILHSGPNLQGDLMNILLNFRLYLIAMTADCRQMFLQIVMREEDRRYQQIYYRFSPRDPLLLYRFNRVCFGLRSSPYHALRTVKQLIADDGHKYPRASRIVSSSLYMDDIAFSIADTSQAKLISGELIDLFKGAQWDLVKWNSNSRDVLDAIPQSHTLHSGVEFDKNMQHKILGLYWSTQTDEFYFKLSPLEEKCTKRFILSTIARLWDIMGFVAPTVLYAKLLIKNLWQLRLDWDEIPPPDITKLWYQFCAELPALNELRIPRHLGIVENCIASLVGFSDASERAYGGVVYLHVSSVNGITVQIICAKSKVAPATPHTIARLELCAAVLLSKLMRVVMNTYSTLLSNIYAFVDSKVALYWIKSSPHRWQTFVANRVVKVAENIPVENFYHVSGAENPADCLSRGLTPHKLIAHPLWFRGPSWLSRQPSQWPINTGDILVPDNIPEQKLLAYPISASPQDSVIYELALRISSWSKLLRIVVYVCRFAHLLPRRESLIVMPSDLELAENKLLQILQRKYFADEIVNLDKGKPCSRAFNKLRPFLHNGIIRVGGRLCNSVLEYTNKHPVVLPSHDHIVNLLVDHYHRVNLHAGPELLMSLLRQKFWIMSARRIIRKRIHMCNRCFKMKPRATYPLMADLPDSRTRPVIKAFTHTGCDYAGPIAYTPVRRRGVKGEKAYICVFTCLTTRATHIEVATDLSTPSFLAALKRFLSRRGPVQCMYSDNGTNFVGANTYLKELYRFLNKDYRHRLEEELTQNRINWKFNCPASGHFGGCWESMVKVIKSHLFRVIGQQLLSYEELTTVLVQIECLLNSRPLTKLSSDPAEPSALTPAHFLHTAPLYSLPAPEVESDNVSLLHRHSLLDKLVQSFWKRWNIEYLHSLQVRQKWNTPSNPIAVGTVVVIVTDNSPPLSWPLAVVEKVHPAKDGIIRVVTVKTAKGTTYLRPVVRLCPLPTQ